ncbi:hypothetical protein SAMN05216553_109149 [Lentzea fradiae]|uniref:Uncharacterized protein n=1 Tax=Lentzea fradiae TaxID=200378 RepID=A0A1G7VCF7_9PSEU|nr:hypothetical protein [Lentzea fradiae]SDG57434.1 hypothetical protein SAMN05216553_109149 [Lentzea fradiae]
MADIAGKARAEQTEVTLRSKTMVLDFEGECRVERTGDSVRLSGLRLVAELPDPGGREDGGTVVLEQTGDSRQTGEEVAVPIGATVAQPDGEVKLIADVRWTAESAGDLVAADDEIGFVLAEAPESTVLFVRNLRVKSS